MVAISLYRGNLHRLPHDVPRRWLLPTPSISFKDFRHLLLRRAKALSLLASSSSSSFATATATTIAVSNTNPISNLNLINSPPPDFKGPENPNLVEAQVCNNNAVRVDFKTEDVVVVQNLNRPTLVVDVEFKTKEEIEEKGKEIQTHFTTDLEGNDKGDTVDEKEKRKREVEEKLHILNEKKHNLVQALKQILNAEEELKRRSSMQASRPPLPLQVDASNDSGSMTCHNTPRTGSDANLTVDVEGGEGDDAINNNPQSRQLLRMNSTSPSAESALKRAPYFLQHNVIKLYKFSHLA